MSKQKHIVQHKLWLPLRLHSSMSWTQDVRARCNWPRSNRNQRWIMRITTNPVAVGVFILIFKCSVIMRTCTIDCIDWCRVVSCVCCKKVSCWTSLWCIRRINVRACMPPVMQNKWEKKRRLDHAVAGTSKILSFFVTTTAGGEDETSGGNRVTFLPSFLLPFRYSTSLLGEPGSPSIVVLCGCAFVWTMSKICVKEVC